MDCVHLYQILVEMEFMNHLSLKNVMMEIMIMEMDAVRIVLLKMDTDVLLSIVVQLVL